MTRDLKMGGNMHMDSSRCQALAREKEMRGGYWMGMKMARGMAVGWRMGMAMMMEIEIHLAMVTVMD